MAYNKIKILLDKYWDGKTSIEEENTLKKYFNSNKVADDLKPYKSLFNFYEDAQNELPSSKLEESILESIGETKTRKLSPWKPFLRTAAAILLLAFGGLTIYNSTQNTDFKQAVVYDNQPEDARKALAEVKAALALVSNKMDKGTNKAVLGISKTKSANNIFKLLNK